MRRIINAPGKNSDSALNLFIINWKKVIGDVIQVIYPLSYSCQSCEGGITGALPAVLPAVVGFHWYDKAMKSLINEYMNLSIK